MYMYTHQGNPYYSVDAPVQTSYIRVLHASPDAPAVDVYANDNLISKNLSYKQLTPYLPVMPGIYNLKVYPAGQQVNPVINTNVTVTPNSAFTIAAVGKLANIGLLPIHEIYMPQVPMNMMDNSYVRFVHLSPDAPAVDITLPDGTKLFENVSYKEYTNYIGVKPGTYTLQVKPTGSDKVVLTVPNVSLMPGMLYSVYAVGLVGENPPLEAIISSDGKYQ
ncbi:MAG: DUF4397 domain-containing protein [Bacillota bacterium]|nr:DUF4397 domain-containing protein [Bacillota bacterium]